MKPILDKTDAKVKERAEKVFKEEKVALFIVAYNAEKFIRETIERIPLWCRGLFSEIYVIDDSSRDFTYESAISIGKELGLRNFSVMKTPQNQGYGGNQKIGYTYAIKNNYDIAILLHGDGQYPPEYIPNIVATYEDRNIEAVFGSRMAKKLLALKGGMPLYKWLGNQILTWTENFILKTKLSEFHNGYRSYRISALKKIPFESNSDDFHFDTDIIIQLVLKKSKIVEIPMPTHYGDEQCYVNGMKYALNCFKSAVKSRLHQAGIFFQPNFEILQDEKNIYKLKNFKTSLHHFILNLRWRKKEKVADLGANNGLLSQKIAEKGMDVTAVDLNIEPNVPFVKTLRMDLNSDFEKILKEEYFHKVVALDVIEHLNSPEKSVASIQKILKPNGKLYASTANIGYIITRLTLLFGWFNYGKSGILDRTHKRLFTIGSFKRLIQNSGFKIIQIRGFGPPIVDSFGNNFFWRMIDHLCSLLAEIYPKLFAFNFLIIARKKLSVEEKTKLTESSRQI